MATDQQQPFSVYSNFYLVGIKGVAMTSLAQILVDLGKKVGGCDVEEAFVTQEKLDLLGVSIDTGFSHTLPETTDCVIYTAAHQGADNPLVVEAVQKDIPTYSHAAALGHVFDAQKGVAVCGVGGKSTVSAMITWVLTQLGHDPSYSVGVGSIIGLEKTGRFTANSTYFVAEADEYVTNPQEVQRGAAPEPRFSYLHPFCTVCTNLSYDHPDVYSNFDQTKEAFTDFFSQIKPGGVLILNHKDLPEVTKHSASEVRTFGSAGECDYLYVYDEADSHAGVTKATIIVNAERFELTLKVPGRYNVENAVAAIAACDTLGFDIEEVITALASFGSTQRRFEYKGDKHGITFYDDYAHHPSELKAVLHALTSWYPNKEVYVAFQPHTYSRTKTLLNDFASTLAAAPNLVLLDIFASAREAEDTSISSAVLAKAIRVEGYIKEIPVLANYHALAEYVTTHIPKGSVCITLGAGDIYKVHELL